MVVLNGKIIKEFTESIEIFINIYISSIEDLEGD